MEIIKLSLCRLCAQSRRPAEMVGRIDSSELNIETKLVICCQWNTINEMKSDKMPKDVCAPCFRILDQSWNFAEQVKRAQNELHLKLEKQDDLHGFKQEQKIEVKSDFDADEDTDLNYIELKIETDIQTHSPLSVAEQIDDFDPMDIDSDEQLAAVPNAVNDTSEKFEVETANEIVNVIVDEIEPGKPQPKIKFQERDFLKSIGKNDRNTDGTVKLEAVQRLGLDNWSILLHKCYICKVVLPDQYEWHRHIKVEHPGMPQRFLCNICDDKDYIKREPLYKHMISNHRGYFKFCCRKCYSYYWDLNRLQSHLSTCCRKTQNEQSLCDICGIEVKKASMLRTHRRSHFEEIVKPIFECYLCRKTFLSRRGIKYHMPTVHVSDVPEHTCSICNRGFLLMEKKERHMLTHLDIFPFECPYCERKFRFKNRFDTHVRAIHTGIKPYACILCDYRCSDSGNLCKHMKQKHGMTKTEAKRRLLEKDI